MTTIVLLVAFAALAALQWSSARWLYHASFDSAELREALAQARHAQTITRDPLSYLERTTIDNGMWDEAYAFVAGRNRRHPDNLAAMGESFRLMRMSAYAFVRLDGSVLFVRQYDARREKLTAGDPALIRALEPSGSIGRLLKARGATSTYTRVDNMVYAWSSAPVLHSDGTGPQIGWWLMLSAFDQRFLESASRSIGATVSLDVRPRSAADLVPVHTPIGANEIRVSLPDDGDMDVRFTLGSLDDTSTLDIVLRSERTIHTAAGQASKYLLWTTLLFGTAVILMALRFVRRRLLAPVEAASSELLRIGRSGDLSRRLAPAPAEDQIGRLVGATNAMLAELELHRDIEAAMLQAIPDALVRVDADGTVLEVRVPGQAAGAWPIAGEPLGAQYPAAAADALADGLAQARRHRETQQVEFSAQLGDGCTCTYEARIAITNTGEALVLIRDITQRKTVENQVTQLAFVDGLTQLPNRSAFLERLAREVRRAAHSGERFGLLFLDLDGFKQINDTMGHDAGDQALLRTAERLREALRPADALSRMDGEGEAGTVARLGGDEFTILITDARAAEDFVAVANRIGDVMRRPFEINGGQFTLTASIGIAIYPDDGRDARALLQHADTAMYYAKRQGRDNIQLYSAALTEQAMVRLELESSLRGALGRGEFHLVYQPVVELATGRMTSVEALIRWQHPTRGLVSPATFIPVAEENGLIVDIGHWVLQTACADLARWRRKGIDIRVAVNISPRQFRGADLVDTVIATLSRQGLAPEHLELEITEGVVMERSGATVGVLNEFRERGVRIALDDFGTGYSSLGYLLQIPIDVIKIDRSFVGKLSHEKRSASIVRAILALGGALGVSVTAEGVETPEQAGMLDTMACRHGQGYYFSRPVRASDIPELAATDWRARRAEVAM